MSSDGLALSAPMAWIMTTSLGGGPEGLADLVKSADGT